MNVLRSFLSGVLRPTPPSLNFIITRSVTQKPPGQRPDLAKKKGAVALPAAFVPYHLRPRAPNNPKAARRRMHPTPQPKVNWIHDMTIPRTSVLSYNPLNNHRWHDHRMLRDVKRRAYVQRDGRVRSRLRSLLRTNLLPKEFSEFVQNDILKLPRDSNYIRLHNRCVVTSRPRAVLHRYRMSRIVWRNLADHNLVSGVLRAKWGNRNNKVYWHHIDPDLHGTLRAVDPVYDVKGRINKELDKWEEKYSGKTADFFVETLFNQNIFKTERFHYPSKHNEPPTKPVPFVKRL